jgi:integrase
MAWITPKGSKFLVRWREADGRTRSRMVDTAVAADRLAGLMTVEEELRPRRSRKAPYRATPAGFVTMRPPKAPRTFASFAQEMIESDRTLRPASRRRYLSALKMIEDSRLARAPLADIDAPLIRETWNGLDKSRATTWQLLSKTFAHAEDDGAIFDNPFRRAKIRRPSEPQTEVTPLTVAQIERLADHAASARDRCMILLMAYAGLRAGEVGGLRVLNVDFPRCRLSIRQQATQDGGIGLLKTRAARRTITVECGVIEELKAFLEANPPAPDGRIFHGDDDRKLFHAVRVNDAVRRAALAAGLDVHAHDLRHSAVSLLIDAGANPVAIQQFVGHSNIKQTLGTYGHLFPNASDVLATSMTNRREEYRRNGAG